MVEHIENKATVVMLRGHGEERLRQAIMQGLVREELTEDFNEVIAQVDNLKRDLKFAEAALADAHKSLDQYRAVYFEALRAKQREDKRRRKYDEIKSYAVAFGIIFAVVLLCTIICRAIFG